MDDNTPVITRESMVLRKWVDTESKDRGDLPQEVVLVDVETMETTVTDPARIKQLVTESTQ